MSVEHPQPTSTEQAPPKTVLICQSCGYESEISGDWRRQTVSTPVGPRIAYKCPTCRETITHRPPADD